VLSTLVMPAEHGLWKYIKDFVFEETLFQHNEESDWTSMGWMMSEYSLQKLEMDALDLSLTVSLLLVNMNFISSILSVSV
jgi:hypothetical protein